MPIETPDLKNARVSKTRLAQKRPKTPKVIRKESILALQSAGLTQDEIAEKLGVSRRSIVRDITELRPAQAQVKELLDDIQSEYANLQSPEDIAWNYVELSENAKNEAVRLAAQDRILEHRGVITEKERNRTKQAAMTAQGPMFIFQGGLNIDFGGTANGSPESLHNTRSVIPPQPVDCTLTLESSAVDTSTTDIKPGR